MNFGLLHVSNPAKACAEACRVEPDFLPVSVAESTLAPRLASLRLTKISGTAETVIYNGGSLWVDYWTATITEVCGDLISSGKLDQALIDRFLPCCSASADGLRPLLSPECTAACSVAKSQHRL